MVSDACGEAYVHCVTYSFSFYLYRTSRGGFAIMLGSGDPYSDQGTSRSTCHGI